MKMSVPPALLPDGSRYVMEITLLPAALSIKFSTVYLCVLAFSLTMFNLSTALLSIHLNSFIYSMKPQIDYLYGSFLKKQMSQHWRHITSPPVSSTINTTSGKNRSPQTDWCEFLLFGMTKRPEVASTVRILRRRPLFAKLGVAQEGIQTPTLSTAPGPSTRFFMSAGAHLHRISRCLTFTSLFSARVNVLCGKVVISLVHDHDH